MTPEVRPVGALMRTLMTLMGFVLLAGTADAACNSPTGAAGDMTYSTSANVMVYCDGTNWISMAGGVSLTVNTTGGVTPYGTTGDVQINGGGALSGDTGNFTYSASTLAAPIISASTGNITTLNSNLLNNTGLGTFGSILDNGGLTVLGAASMTTVSASAISGTIIQVGDGGGAVCNSTLTGSLRYSSISNTIQICSNSVWTSLASGTITGSGVNGGSATAIAFWNGPNSLTYESATTTGLYWDHPNGRLGVGTNSPSNSLHVIGGSGQGNAMILEANASGGYSGNALQFRRGMAPSTTGWAIGGDVPGSSAAVMTDDLIFSSFSGVLPWVERMRIVSGTGFVGIANGSPTATLQISGTFIVSQTNQNSLASASLAVDSRGVSVSSIIHINGSPGSAMGAGSNQIVSGTSNVTANQDSSVTITTAGSQRMIIGANGNVGIGTNHATAPLTVQADVNSSALNIFGRSSDDKSAIVFYNNNATNPNNFGYIQAGPTYLAVATNNSERMRIDSVGNVGIGTSSPGFTLDVSGSLRMLNSSNNASVSVQYSGASGRIYQFISCKLCGSTGVGGLVVYDATAPADRAYIAAGVNGWQTPSDRRLKKDIETLSVLDKLGPVRGVSYKLKDSGMPQIGVIAQEIDQSFPLAVTGKNDGAKFLGVSYDAIAAIALEGVKELKALFDEDHARLEAANDNIQTLSRQVDALREEVRQLKQLKK